MKEDWDKLWSKAGKLEHRGLEHDNPVTILFEPIKAHFRGRKVGRIAELGCGAGIRALLIARELKARQVFLVDFSKEALKVAAANAKQMRMRAVTRNEDVVKMRFPDGYFDCVFNDGVYEHFKGAQRTQVFREMFRVLKKGGIAIAVVPPRTPFILAGQRVREALGTWQFGYQENYSKAEARRIMQEIGVKDYELIDSGYFLQSIGFLLPGSLSKRFAKATEGMKTPLDRWGNALSIIMKK